MNKRIPKVHSTVDTSSRSHQVWWTRPGYSEKFSKREGNWWMVRKVRQEKETR